LRRSKESRTLKIDMSFLALLNASPTVTRRGLEALKAEDAALASHAWGVSGFHKERAVYFGRRALPAFEDGAQWQRAIDIAERSKTKILVASLNAGSEPEANLGDVAPFLWQEWMLVQAPGAVIPESLPMLNASPQGSSSGERWLLYLLGSVRHAIHPTDALLNALEQSFRRSAVPSAFVLTNGSGIWAYAPEGIGNELYRSSLEGGIAAVWSSSLTALTTEWKKITPKTLMIADAAGAFSEKSL
jgi:hypothetical protein